MTLLITGAAPARYGGASVGTVLIFALAAVVAALVFGRRTGVLVLGAGAALILVLGSHARVELAQQWAVELTLRATWVRFAVVYFALGVGCHHRHCRLGRALLMRGTIVDVTG